MKSKITSNASKHSNDTFIDTFENPSIILKQAQIPVCDHTDYLTTAVYDLYSSTKLQDQVDKSAQLINSAYINNEETVVNDVANMGLEFYKFTHKMGLESGNTNQGIIALDHENKIINIGIAGTRIEFSQNCLEDIFDDLMISVGRIVRDVTQFIFGIKDDNKIVISSKVHHVKALVKDILADEVLIDYIHNQGYKICVSGHSLGGNSAEMLANILGSIARLAYINDDGTVKIFKSQQEQIESGLSKKLLLTENISTITFDSAGGDEAHRDSVDLVGITLGDGKIKNYDGATYYIDSRPNVINGLDTKCEEIHNAKHFTIHNESFKGNKFYHLATEHSINNFIGMRHNLDTYVWSDDANGFRHLLGDKILEVC